MSKFVSNSLESYTSDHLIPINDQVELTQENLYKCAYRITELSHKNLDLPTLQKNIVLTINEFYNYDLIGIASDNKGAPYLNTYNCYKNSVIKETELPLFPPSSMIKSCYFNLKSFFTQEVPSSFKVHNKQAQFVSYPILRGNKFEGFIYAADQSVTHLKFVELISKILSPVLGSTKTTNSGLNQTIDPLTNLPRIHYFLERLKLELLRSKRTLKPLSIILFDINHLERINSTFGYIEGDKCIRYLSNAIRNNIREIDLAARYGGDEIIVMLTESRPSQAKLICNRILNELSKIDDLKNRGFSFSAGISVYPNTVKNGENLILWAVQALFEAKSRGRDNLKIVKSNRPANEIDFRSKSVNIVVHSDFVSGIDATFKSSVQKCLQLDRVNLKDPFIQEVIMTLAGTIDAKDRGTKGHSQAVSYYASKLSAAVGLHSQEIENIRLGGLLHDIGKIGIPESILLKPGPLTNSEWDLMKLHPTIGAHKILKHMSAFSDIVPIVELHHERWDGSGYPKGLKGTETPLSARIVAVVDSFHTMISSRPYKKPLSIKKALEIIEEGSGIYWDPGIVPKFIGLLAKMQSKY